MLMLLVLACSGEPAPEGASLDAPTASGSAPRVTIDRVRVVTDLAAIRASLRAHRTMHDGFPSSLDDLQLRGLSYPDAYSYDASAGEVSCSEFPGL